MHNPWSAAGRGAHRVWLVAAACVLLAAACSPPTLGGSLDPNAPKGEVVTAEAIAETHAGNVWDALRWTVRNLTYRSDHNGRPMAIRARGRSYVQSNETVLVYVDGVQLADISVLGQMAASSVERFEILSGIEASTYFGTNAGDGVIHIITKNR
ncbi:MAG: TonB-dependent receptor plug domain-containing protein [Longimicrobiales bacterium]